MKRLGKWYIVLGLLLVTSLLIIPSANTQPKEYITLGSMLPLTGGVASEGNRHKEGYDLWAKVCNEKGGINIGNKVYGVKIIHYDYESRNETAMKLTEKMITQDGIKFILGPVSSATIVATSAVSEKYGAITVVATGGSIKAFTPGYKYLFGTLSDNLEIIKPLIESAIVKKDPPKTSAIAARNDLFPLAVAENFKKVAEDAGIKTLDFSKYPPFSKDFSAVLTKIKQLNPDWIFISGLLEDTITATKNMKQLDVNAKVISLTAGPSYLDYIKALGKDADYISTPTWWHEKARWIGDDIFGPNQNYNRIFRDTYGHTPDYLTASAATCGVVFQKAFEKANSLDVEKVRDAMASLNFKSFFGPIKFGPVGQNIALPGVTLQIKDKDWLVIKPKEIADSDLIYFKKWKDRK